jgi:hypothetical protein
MTDDEKQIFHTLLKTQEVLNESLMSTRTQLDSLIRGLIRLDTRIAALYSEEFANEQKKQAELLEQVLKGIALLRAVVPKTVQ